MKKAIPPSKRALAHAELLAGVAALPVVDLPDAAKAAIVKLRRQQNDDPRVVVPAAEAAKMLSRGRTTIAKLIDQGDLLVMLDGQDQRVLVESVYDLLVARVRASYAPDGTLKRRHGFRGVQHQHMSEADWERKRRRDAEAAQA